MLLILAVVCLAGAAFALAQLVTLPAREREASLQRASSWARGKAKVQAQSLFQRRTLQQAKERVARLVLRMNPKASVEEVSFRLIAAGLGRRITPTGFLAGKAFLALAGMAFGVVIGSGSSAALGIMLALMFAAVGFIAPDFFVKSRAKARRAQLTADLPDALDLLAVSVEAGLGFDAAMAKVTENMGGPVAEEFALTLSEIRIGESRVEALKKFAERAGTPEISSFARSIIQADQFGISLGRILRVQASESRLRRQAAAEERAMKAPIKMLFPTVMFVVTLGPAFLQIRKVL